MPNKPHGPRLIVERGTLLTFQKCKDESEAHPELYCGDWCRDPGPFITSTRTVEAGRWCIEDPYYGPALVYRSRRPGVLERWFARWLLVGWTWQDRAEYAHG